MIWPVNHKFDITADYFEPRPFSVPPEARTRLHGAVDIAAPEGTEIFAPEDGELYYHMMIRKEVVKKNHDIYHPIGGAWYPFSNYFIDVWGVCILLLGHSGCLHVFVHSNPEVMELLETPWNVQESSHGALISNLDRPKQVEKADHIGYSGNTGLSTGPHIHYEIHNGWRWTAHGMRPNPLELEWEGRLPRVRK